jgi:hypothetical protein
MMSHLPTGNTGNSIGMRHVKVRAPLRALQTRRSILVPPGPRAVPALPLHLLPHPISPAASLPQVAAPPGGATSWSLGWGSEPAPPSNNRRGAQAQAAYAAAPSVNPYAAAGAEAAPVAAAYGAPAYPSAAPAAIKENTSALPAPRVGVSANVFANGANQNAGERTGGRFFFLFRREWARGLLPRPCARGVAAPRTRAPRSDVEGDLPAPQARDARACGSHREQRGTERGRENATAHPPLVPSPTPPPAGNFITDRPTTKVHGPPGGRSSIVFG